MTRFCGQCGTILEASAWYVGRCPGCGAVVDVTRGVVGPGGVDSADVATKLTPSTPDVYGSALDAPATPASTADMSPLALVEQPIVPLAGGRRQSQKSRRTSLWTMALISAVVIALVGVLAYLAAPRGGISILLAPFTASGASALSSSSSNSSVGVSATATSPGRGFPTQTPGPRPTASIGPGGTPVASPTVTATAGPTPTLSVTQTSFLPPLCPVVPAMVTFSVANTGGGLMSWSATWEPSGQSGYTVSPPSGTLSAGASITVTVSNITTHGTVTFSAPGANGSPQVVSITCTLPVP